MKTETKLGGWAEKRGGKVVRVATEYEKKEKSIVEMVIMILVKT